MKKIIFIFFYILTTQVYAEVTYYELNITRGDITIDGKLYENKVLVNGGIPAPELVFNNGDTAEIRVINKTNEKTLIHWHGLLIKNDQDGVPYVNSLPIEPNSEKLYRFKLRQTGTYWYHSHVMFQEEDGLYGAFTILPDKTAPELSEKTVVLSDLTSELGEEVQKNVKKDGEYYDVLKGTVQSWLEAFRSGNALTKWRNSLQRMEGMDYADIAYDKFLVNGKQNIDLFNDSSKKKKVKLRIINGSATSIFKLTYGGEFITVVGADGLPVEPVQVKVLPISVAETYDIVVQVAANKRVELRATSLDNSGYSSIWLGRGSKDVSAPDMQWEHPISTTMAEMMGMKKMGFFQEFAMNYRNEFTDLPKEIRYDVVTEYKLPDQHLLRPMMKKMEMGKKEHQKMMKPEQSFRIMNMSPASKKKNKLASPNKNPLFNELTYGLLKAKEPINVNKKAPLRTVKFTLNGNMGYYIWSINGVPVGPDTYIKINKGERVRFIMNNTTMMNHPMHLHGHFFRVMTNQGKWSVLKHTVNVAPLGQTVIEFDASEEKDWFFHCHILYHMMAGMTRIVRYENQPGPQELESAREKSKEFNFASSFFLRSRNFIQSNYYRTETSAFNSFYNVMFDVVGDYDKNLEGEVHIARILTRYLQPYIGAKTEAESGDFETTPTIGLTWVLPLNISVDIKYQPLLEKKMELEFENEIQLTSKLQFNYEYSSQRNFYGELEYRQTKNLSFLASYNKTYKKWGAGLAYTY